MSDRPPILDAEFEVVAGPMRVGDPHRTRKDWYFTGRYNAEGDPYFIRGAGWWRRRRIGRAVYFWSWMVAGAVVAALLIAYHVFGVGKSAVTQGGIVTREEAIAEAKARGLLTVDQRQ